MALNNKEGRMKLEHSLIPFVVESLNHVQLFCDPMDCSPQVPLSMGFLQARILE